MTLKELAYSTQHRIQDQVGSPVKPTHVYEMLAAAFGFKSYAAFGASCVFSDAGVGNAMPGLTPELIGRVSQLKYPPELCASVAQSLVDHALTNQVSFIALNTLLASLSIQENSEDEDDENGGYKDKDEDELVGFDSKPGLSASEVSGFLSSALLMDSLEQKASNNPSADYVIAMLYRCKRPNSYLHDESLKGRVLNQVEQKWADGYLLNQPNYEKHVSHLRRSAEKGVRQAAADFAQQFDDPKFFTLAERGSGPVNARQMALIARTLNNRDSERQWLWVAGNQGSLDALYTLALDGDALAQKQLAESGDLEMIRNCAEEAAETNPQETWMWLYLAELLGKDFTKSTLRAYHDGGQQNGEAYDSDFGGPIYVGGEDGFERPSLTPTEELEAQKVAEAIFERIPKKRSKRAR